MPIHVPGKRDRRGNKIGAKRSVVAVLSLTAMVDLFTVLVVFLLQNYNVTGEIIEIPKGVELPMAQEVRELKPANVVIISQKDIRVNNRSVIDYDSVNDGNPLNLSIPKLKEELVKAIDKSRKEHESVKNKIKKAVQKVGKDDEKEEEVEPYKKITIQADKEVTFLVVKKVMYTVTESVDSITGEGIAEINFAVLKRIDEEDN